MLVRIRIRFDRPNKIAKDAIQWVAKSLTNHKASVRVFADPNQADFLMAEFTMPTESQYKVVDRISNQIRLMDCQHIESTIEFPRDEMAIEWARRKAKRRQKNQGPSQ